MNQTTDTISPAAEERKAEGVDAAASEPTVILPYSYGADEHYYIEDPGVLPKKPWFSFCKRLFDIAVSLLALIVAALPMLCIAVAVRVSSPGGVFYRQERLGLNGRPFYLIKFRTMVADAEKNGIQWSLGAEDHRITKVGLFLRKTRMDELPQLWQCLIGQMSLIGPRPERPAYYKAFEEHVHGFSHRLKVKPGITGYAQVCGGYNLRPEEKAKKDMEYIQNRSFRLEWKIIWKTVKVLLNHDGAK